MSNKIIYITCLAMIIATSIEAQNTIDNVLSEVAKNNKSILSNAQYWEAKKLSYKTGLSLSNPKIEYEYLNGSPATAGVQTDLFIIQEFDFPTSYIKKKQVSNQQIAKIEFEQKSFRQSTLLRAKQYCIELIYLNKRQAELNKRLIASERLYKDFKLKFDNGGSNRLEMNKANLQFINFQNEVGLNQSEINQYNHKLTELNGGNNIVFNETNYPLNDEVPDFILLEKTIEENDPNLMSFNQQKQIYQKQMELSRAMSLPKIEGGFRSQKLLGQTFQGIHLGITIPLWGSKNTVKYQKKQLLFSELLIEEHSTEHFYEIKQLYEKYETLKNTLAKYQQILGDLNNSKLLDKSLELGEISFIQYFMEINYFYTSYDDYLNLEKEYYLVLSELYKYKL